MGRLGEIFRAHGADYRNRFGERMSVDQLRAMRAVERCHTPAAGGVLWRCTRSECDLRHFTFRGCGNRHGPACGQTHAEEWLRKQSALLLPGVTYHLVTFTVHPNPRLRRLIRSHPRELLEMLMRTASSTLMDLCNNPRWVGGVPGATAVLHTWTRQYQYHPHVHFILTGGALDPTGQWRHSHPKFLVPVTALSSVFRARFRDALQSTAPTLLRPVFIPVHTAPHRSARAPENPPLRACSGTPIPPRHSHPTAPFQPPTSIHDLLALRFDAGLPFR
jgi:hypothetical protein